MVKYWICPIKEKNWHIVREKLIYGAKEKSQAAKKIKRDDVIIFYVLKREAKEYGGMVVGAFKVSSDWYRSEELLWDDEKELGIPIYVYKVRIKPIKLGRVPIVELIDKLKFIKNKEKFSAYLMGSPANFRKPIPEEDALTIIGGLR